MNSSRTVDALQGSGVVVTGGASGLGRATADRLLAAGASVCVCDLNESAGRQFADQADRAIFARTDVTDSEAVSAALDMAMDHFGRIDALIQCAGVATAEKILTRDGPQPLEHFESAVRINLIGTFNVLRLTAERMRQNAPREDGERGVVVNTSSIAAFEGQIGQSAYAASKAGVAAMTLPAARELARDGIRVVCIAPGIFDTPLLAGLPEKAREALSEQMPFPRRLGSPDEFASLAEEILRNRYLNGAVIRLDGALRMPPR